MRHPNSSQQSAHGRATAALPRGLGATPWSRRAWLAGAVLAAAACGGGGGGGGASGYSFSLAQSGSESPETDGGVTIEVVLHAPGGELTEDVELAFVDTGNGSATSGVDYQALDTLTVLFPAGSLDGATRSVTWIPMDDGSAEGSETIDVALVRTGAGATRLGGGVLRILDDESATLKVARGSRTGEIVPSGGELAMGNQTIGVPTDVGVDLWLDNIGAAALRVSTPVLASGATSSFHVELGESLSATATHAGPPVESALPLRAVGATAAVGPTTALPLVYSEELAAGLLGLESIVLRGVPVPGGLPLDLVLERVATPVRPGAVLSIDGAAEPGGIELLADDLSLWSGHVEGDPEARAFLAFSRHGTRGWVRTGSGPDAETVHLLPHAGSPALTSLVTGAGLAAAGIQAPTEVCGGVAEIPGREGLGVLAPAATDPGDRHTPYVCRLALETDYQLYEKFGDAGALTTYVTELLGAVSDRFATDVGTTLEIVYLGIHTTPADPWSTPDGSGGVEELLYELQTAWAPVYGGSWPAAADLAHFLSGAPIGGGIAFVDSLCDPNHGFGVSASLDGSVDWSAYDGGSSAMYWDFNVLAHELGHAFAARHTHQYCPPLDRCALSCEGQLCGRGTIMSYCHACGGGSANVDLEFHPAVANEMRAAVNRSCLTEADLAPGDARFFRVFFRPDANPGEHAATLELAHDASSAPSPYRITLVGTADLPHAEEPESAPLGHRP